MFPKSFLLAVQMAPPTLNVTKGRDGYLLRWEVKMFYNHIEYTFEVQYKKNETSWEVRGLEEGRRGRHACETIPGRRHLQVTSQRKPLGQGGRDSEAQGDEVTH